jgi:phenylalanyl-tRNA synthetase beta chain
MILQDHDKTLEDKDINDVVNRVVETLAEQLNATLRN